jgi:hypothetical protein
MAKPVTKKVSKKVEIKDMEKEYSECLRDHLLELFVTPLKEFKTDELKSDKDINVSFRVTPKDYKYMVADIELDTIMREYSYGVSIKKPFVLKVVEITDEVGNNIDGDSQKLLRTKKIKALDDQKSLELFRQADKLILSNEGDEIGKFEVNFVVRFENNPDFGLPERDEKEERRTNFSKDSVNKLKEKLNSDDYTPAEKEEIVEELYRKGIEVDY